MQLKDFSYSNTVTSELVKYSHGISGAITSFNKDNSSQTGIIFQVPCCGLFPEEDRFAYWDSGKEITYGRYLLFRNIKWEIIKFWTGFSASRKKTKYYIWFKEADVLQYIGNLQKKPFPNALVKNGEASIPMGNSNITSQTLKDFWHSVLEVLKDEKN